MRKLSFEEGEKFGRFTVLREKYRDKCGRLMVECRCNCGNIVIVNGSTLKNGTSKSCGCLRNEMTSKAKKTHGMFYTPEYECWRNMIQRCNNKNNTRWRDYGGRGIKVCKRWLVFENFYEDIGKRPYGMTLDRIDNDGNYEPSNCRWATQKEQVNNTRANHNVTYNGETKTIKQWAENYNINYGTLKSRIKLGWKLEHAFLLPPMPIGKITYKEYLASIDEDKNNEMD